MRACTLGVCLAAGATLLGAQSPSLEDVLARAAAYVEGYQKQLAGIVLEEEYTQDVRPMPGAGLRTGAAHRELRSDLLLVRPADDDRWVQFRDVFEVDRKPIRDRDARLERLFLKPSPTSYEQAERIALESARYNLGNVTRTVNLPVMALLYLHPTHRERSEFEQVRPGNLRPFTALVKAESDVWAVSYKETAPETLIRTTGDRDLPAHGRFWIDAATGRVLRSELIAEDVEVRGKIDVTYRLEEGLGFLVPAEMREEYSSRLRSTTRIVGRATYGKFKRFTVTTDEAIKKPGGGEE